MGAFFVALDSMKTLILSILALFSINNCKQENIELNYIAQSRGFFLEIELQSNILKVTNQRGNEAKERQLSKIEQEELRNIVTSTDFDNVETLDSTKSHYDAAAMASLTLTLDGNNHEFEFDHGNPPRKLESFVNKIITLSEIVE